MTITESGEFIVEPVCSHFIEGHQDIAFNDDGSLVYTCGLGGKIQWWSTEDSSSLSAAGAKQVSPKTFALASKPGSLYVATDDLVVVEFQLPAIRMMGMVTRFTAPATQLVVSSDGSLMAAASRDFNVKLVQLSDQSQSVFLAHSAPVLSVDLNPSKDRLVTAGGDQTLKLWDVGTQRVIRNRSGFVPRCNDFALCSDPCRIKFSQTGNVLYVPRSSVVQLWDPDAWKCTSSLRDGQSKTADGETEFTIVDESRLGKYVVAASCTGDLRVWDPRGNPNVCVAKIRSSKRSRITALRFNPFNTSQLIFAQYCGTLGLVDNVSAISVALSEAAASKAVQREHVDRGAEKSAESLLDDLVNEDDAVKLLDDIDGSDASESDDEDLKQLRRKHSEKRGSHSDDEDNHNDNDDSDARSSRPKQPKRASSIASRASSHLENDPIAEKLLENAQEKLDTLDDVDFLNDFDEVDLEAGTTTVASERRVVIERVEAQLKASFQPGSTPEHLAHRFMVWNTVGVVRQHQSDDDNMIDVEFTDTATHHALTLSNTRRFNIASLSDTALLLARGHPDDPRDQLYSTDCSESADEFLCMHFATWDNAKEWSEILTSGESIQAVAASSDWLAVATNRRWLRLYTISGTHLPVLTVGGPVLAVSALRNRLVVVYHNVGAPYSSREQSLGYILYSIEVRGAQIRRLSAGVLPLTPGASLSWIGFSDDRLNCYAADSNGILTLLAAEALDHTWTPVCNLHASLKGKTDSHWVVGVNDGRQQVAAVFCKGAAYPATLPRPFLSMLPLTLPFGQGSLDKEIVEKNGLEQEFWRSKLLMPSVENEFERQQLLIEQQGLLMKMFATACKAQQDCRAFELALLGDTGRLYELLHKYAGRSQRVFLAQRLSELLEAISDENHEADNSIIQHDSIASTVGHNVQLGRSSQVTSASFRASRESHPSDGSTSATGNSGDFRERLNAVYSDADTDWSPRASSQRPRDAAPTVVIRRLTSTEQRALDESADGDGEGSSPLVRCPSKRNPFKIVSPTKKTQAKGSKVFDSNEAAIVRNVAATPSSTAHEPKRQRLSVSARDSKTKSTAMENTPENRKRKLTQLKLKFGFQLESNTEPADSTNQVPNESESTILESVENRPNDVEYDVDDRLEVDDSVDSQAQLFS